MNSGKRTGYFKGETGRGWIAGEITVVIVALLSSLFLFSSTEAGRMKEEVKERRVQQERVERLLSPASRKKAADAIESFKRSLFLTGRSADPQQEAVKAIQSCFKDLSPEGVDILAFYVLGEALGNMGEDMRTIISESGKVRNAKKEYKEYLNKLKEKSQQFDKPEQPPPVPVTAEIKHPVSAAAAVRKPAAATTPHFGIEYPKAPVTTVKDIGKMSRDELAEEIKRIETELNDFSDLSNTYALRLQMIMNRRSKVISTVSNILKKISATQDTIIQNIK